MGYSRTPKYRIDAVCCGCSLTCMTWNSKSYGRVTAANVARLAEAITTGGGVNQPIDLRQLTVRENCTGGNVVAQWTHPDGIIPEERPSFSFSTI